MKRNLVQPKHWMRMVVTLLTIISCTSGWGRAEETPPSAQIQEILPYEGQVGSQGTVYYVAPAPAGSDSNPGTITEPWETIQKAANTLVAGDTVYIKAGTFTEQVIPQNSGSAGNYITYAAYPGDTVTIDGASITLPSWETGLFVVEDTSYIRISGLRIVNAGPNDNNAGIYVDNAHYIIIENNYTYNTVSSGIGVWDGSNVIIDGNEVVLACNDGEQEDITVAGTDTFEIKNNHVHDGGPGTNGGEGITVKDGARNGKVYKNHVHDITGGQRTCLYIDAWGPAGTETYNIEVYQNILHNCGAGISLASEYGGLLRDVTIYNNIVYDNQSNGLEIGDWGESGVITRPIENIVFANNTAYHNGFGTWGGGFYNENPDVKNIVVRNNIFSQNSISQIVNEVTTTVTLTVDHNLIDGSQGYTYAISGTDYVVGDPLFVNAPGADFHLQGASPAIDSGSSVDAPSDDYEGNSRPQDGDGNCTAIYDIGAYEATTNLTIRSTTEPDPVEAATTVFTYTITLWNDGGADATGVTITSTIPNSTTFKSGGDSFVDPSVVWNNLTVTQSSSTSVSFQVSVTVAITNGDQLINAISASSCQGITASTPTNTVIVGLRSVYLPLVLRNATASSSALSSVDDFLYQLQNLNLTAVGNTAYDLVIVDYSADGSDTAAYTAAQINALKSSPGGDKVVLAYMSIGEAENYRFYWQGGWAAGNPAWLDDENPDWPGNYKVHYWDPAWQAIVYSYLDRLLDAGFDGAYLDIIDAYEYYAGQGRTTAAQEMADFVAAIRAYARARDPDFYIFPQNAPELAGLVSTYLNSVDGIGQEDIYYGYSADDVMTSPAVTASLEASLDLFKNAGKLVLTVDYATTPAYVDDAYAKSQAKGYVPFATVRDLDQLTINSGHEPD